MNIIVGLGNPGREYELTRHNAGFLALDVLSGALSLPISKAAHKARIGEGFVDGQKLVLAKPTTFMNLCGQCVQSLYNWYKIEAGQLIIIYDDIELPVGEIRIRPKGSAGTHNGMRSIIELLGRDDFPRIRIGIGGAPQGWELASHVLARPTDENEGKLLTAAIKQAAEAALMIVREGVSAAQARFNRKPGSKGAKGNSNEPE